MAKRILLIDDDEDIRDVIMLLLEGAGYSVVALGTAQDIVTLVKEVEPDVVLLDVIIGNLDGRILCKQLKSNKLTSHIPIIMISAISDLYNAIPDACANDVISKPFSNSTLINRVERQVANQAYMK